MRLIPLVALLASAALAAAAAPVADLEGDARRVEFGGVPHYRLARGGEMTLRVTGPAALELEVRCEGFSPRAVAPLAEVDGKPVPAPEVSPTTDASVRSEKGQALTRALPLRLPLGPGRHAVILRWPREASGDALLEVKGVQVAAALPELALVLPGGEALPLPAAKPPARAAGPSEPLALAPLALGAPAAQPASNRTSVVPAAQTGSATIAFAQAPRDPALERFELGARAGALRSAETNTSASTLGQAGLDLAWHLKPLLPLLLSLDGSLGRQAYQARQTAQDGRGPAHADVDEQRYDGFAGAGYDLGPWLVQSGRLLLLPMLGAQYTAIRNSGFPLDLAGPSVGARARWSLSHAVALQASARWTYNLLKKDTLSLVGTPVSDLGLQAGVSLPLAGGYAFDAGYQGDVLALHYDTRVAHGMSVGLRSSF